MFVVRKASSDFLSRLSEVTSTSLNHGENNLEA
jgi:hypothetical protein